MSGSDKNDDAALKALLPPLAQARLQSLRLADGAATLVLDAGGLGGLERDRLGVAVKDAPRRAEGVREGRAAMVASLSLEFLGQAYHPAPITVHAGAARIGRTSYALDLLLMQDGHVVAFAQTVVVCTDAGGPAEISQAFRTSAQDWMVRA